MADYMIMLGGHACRRGVHHTNSTADIDETQMRKIAVAELSARYVAETCLHQERTRCAVIQTQQRDIHIVVGYRIKLTGHNEMAIGELQPPEGQALALGWH